jgi:alpha-beta hydrolase superfamily lysophospholipase
MRHQTNSLTLPDGFPLFTQTWTPDTDDDLKGVIILIHGLGEHSGRYSHVATYFTERGYIVAAPDHRGHGRSQGKALGYFDRFSQIVDDLHQFIKTLPSASRGLPLYILGHSMGGLVSLHYTIRYTPRIRGLITSGVLLDAGEGINSVVASLVKQLANVIPKFGLLAVDSSTISRDPQVVRAYDADPYIYHGKISARVGIELTNAVEFAKQNLSKIDRPALVMHGGADRLVKPHCSQIIHDGISSADKTLKIYEGLYHEILNEPEQAQVMDDIYDWLKTH